MTSAVGFEKAKATLRRWMKDEQKWYAVYGLKPPRVVGVAHVTVPLYKKGATRYMSFVNPAFNDPENNVKQKREEVLKKMATDSENK